MTQFKSNAERKIADLLDYHNLNWEYEPCTFTLLSGEKYTPDFAIQNYYSCILFLEVKSGTKIGTNYHKSAELFHLLEHTYSRPGAVKNKSEIWDSWKVLLVHDEIFFRPQRGGNAYKYVPIIDYYGLSYYGGFDLKTSQSLINNSLLNLESNSFPLWLSNNYIAAEVCDNGYMNPNLWKVTYDFPKLLEQVTDM